MKNIKYSIFLIFILAIAHKSIAQKGIVNNGGNMVVHNNGIVVVNNGDYINKNSGGDGKITLNGKIYLNGNWTNNGVGTLVTGSAGSVIFNGSALQTIGGLMPTRFNAIVADNNSTLNLGASITIDSLLNLFTGNMNISNYNLTLTEGAKFKNFDNTRYIIAENAGKIEQTISTSSILYPVGSATDYLPVYMKNSGTKDIYGLRIQNSVLASGTSGAAIVSHVANKSWLISESVAGASNLAMTLQWNESNEFADFLRDSCGIGQYLNSSTAWETQLVGQASGIDPYSKSITGVVLDAGENAFMIGDKYSVACDGTPPKLTSVSIASNHTNTNWARAGSIVSLTMTADEALKANPTVKFYVSGVAVLNAITVSNTGGNNYLAQFTVAAGDQEGLVSFTINCKDVKGNSAIEVSSTTDATNVTVDLTAPTITNLTISSNNVNNNQLAKTGDLITLNYILSEISNGLPTATILTNAAVSSQVAGLNYKATYTTIVANAEGIVPFSLQYTDRAGNVSAVYSATTNASQVRFDRTIPLLNTVTLVSNNAVNNQLATKGDVITLNFTSLETLNATPVVTMHIGATLVNGITISPTSSATSYNVIYTILPGDPDGILNFTIDFQDLAGNVGAQVLSTTNSSSIAVDTYLPTASTSGGKTICQLDSALIRIDLTGDSPWNLTYTDGVTPKTVNGIITSPYQFYAKTAGTYQVTQLSDASGHFAVNFGTNAQVLVNALPVLSFSLRDNYNVDSSGVLLSAFPVGGVFSGPGVSGNKFIPSVVGPQSPVVLNYTYTDINNCSNSITATTETRKAAGALNGVNATYCINSADTTFVGVPETGATPSRFVSYKNGIISSVLNSATYRPSTAGQGSDTITYVYNLRGTEYWIKKKTFVDSIGNVDFVTLKSEYCDGDNAVSLSAVFNHPNGSGDFVFSGAGAAFANFGNTASFRPLTIIADNLPKTISYTYTSSISGCVSSVSKNVIVHPLPVLDFNLATNYNVNGKSDTIEAVPTGGTFTGIGMSGDNFYPNIAGVGNGYLITYTYKNPVTMCTNSLSKTTNVQEADAVILGLDTSYIYCYDQPKDTIHGLAINGLPGGYFTGKGITNLNPDTAIFDPVLAGNGVHKIVYYYIGTDGITEFNTEQDVWVDSLGVAAINGLQANYCVNEPQFTLFGSPQNSNGVFYGAGINNNGNGTAIFTASIANIGINTIDYIYTNPASGCKISVSQVTNNHALPAVDFSISDQCIADSIRFTDMTSAIDPIASWNWNFGDNDNLLENTSTLKNPSHLYTTASLKQINLTVMTVAGCGNFQNKIVDFGSSPKAGFSWSNECFGTGSTQFTNLSTGLSITGYKWDFGDGNSSVALDPTHQFDSVANYPVYLVVLTANNCTDTARNTVYVRPYVKSFPYAEDFEAGPDGWVAVAPDSINSWAWGMPNGNIINTAASGSYVWLTGLSDNYKNNEKSSVVGPCFDFTGLDKPMISLKYWSKTNKGLDGTVLQSSIDDGATWQNVGNLNEGINWYNGYSIQGYPGGQQQGWTGSTDTAWVEARHDLNSLIGQTNVRLRIAFGSDANYNDEGFAFDDIWIGDRKKNVVVENFVNAADANSWNKELYIQTIMAALPYDATSVYYHMKTKGSDDFYSANPDISDAQALNYGISAVPYTVLDGSTSTDYLKDSLNAANLMLRALLEPKFDLTVASFINHNTTGDELWLDANLTAKEVITEEVVVKAVIVENVNGLYVGSSGQTNFNNVVRDVIPNVGGKLIKHKWIANQSDSISIRQNMPVLYGQDNYKIVVYVQNSITKEIYQSSILQEAAIATDIDNHLTTENPQMSLYPNPADDIIRINLPKVNEQAEITIVDFVGKVQDHFTINPGTQLVEYELAKYRAGMYIVQYKNKKGLVLVGKFVKK